MVRFLLLLGLWLALSRTLEPAAVVLGAVVCAVAAWVVRWLLPQTGAPRAPLPARVVGALRFSVVLILRFIASTLLTSWLILFRRAEGRVVALPIRLRGATQQFLLLNAITLTPSTISLLLEGSLLYVHWLLPQGWRGDRRQLKDSLEDELLRVEGGADAGGR